ncbi:MAG: response regulator transcription factor [Olsenella sp.]|jgi:DNA-binding NarL/FixJ family response regulator|nr:response regulator transcription factor [Olsenella sp.]MCI1879291.1 response regulator transcription factor [Olsenella sp.]
MIRVMVVDDQRDVRDGLVLMLSRDPDIRVIARCANGVEALETSRLLDADGGALPDVALMDVRMPLMDGIDATRRIHRLWPSVGVLVLTTYDQDDYAFGALAVGASGFLLKDARAQTILDAVRAVHAGDAVLSPRVTREVIARAVPQPASPRGTDAFSRLPPRELKIASLVAEGLSNAEIAERMSIEPASVKRSVSRIIAKLGLGSRVQVAVAWWRAGRR